MNDYNIFTDEYIFEYIVSFIDGTKFKNITGDQIMKNNWFYVLKYKKDLSIQYDTLKTVLKAKQYDKLINLMTSNKDFYRNKLYNIPKMDQCRYNNIYINNQIHSCDVAIAIIFNYLIAGIIKTNYDAFCFVLPNGSIKISAITANIAKLYDEREYYIWLIHKQKFRSLKREIIKKYIDANIILAMINCYFYDPLMRTGLLRSIVNNAIIGRPQALYDKIDNKKIKKIIKKKYGLL